MLGLKLQNTGLTGHLSNRINKSRVAVTKLYRFANLIPEIKTTLVKTLIPQFHYAVYPTNENAVHTQ